MGIILSLMFIVVLCYLIYKSSGIFEQSTEYLGRNMNNGVRGASLNAIASSMPELITSFFFLFTIADPVKGYSGTIGTTAGSAIFNALIIPSLVIILVYHWRVIRSDQTIPLSQRVINRDGIFLIASEAFLLFTIITGEITWIDGAILILIYVLYAVKLIKDSKKSNEDEEDGPREYIPGNKILFRYSVINLIISVALMTIFCYGLVYCVEQLGELTNTSLLFTSVILAAAASSVPDMMISIRDAKSGNFDDAIANALGSNIFDICIAHGLPLFIYTLIYGGFSLSGAESEDSNILRIVLLVVTVLSIFVYKRKGGVNKVSGYLLLGLYLVFLGVVIYRMFI